MAPISELYVLLKYIILGVVQGFTEPIPISSSGHVILVRELFGLDIKGLSFEIIVNFGSLIAVLIIYRRDIMRLAAHSIRYLVTRNIRYKQDFRFVGLLVIATIPAGIIGLLFNHYISNSLTTVYVIAFTLFITGFFLWIIRNLRGEKGDADLTLNHALIIGLAQSVALIPGISRSGATIVAALLLGIKQESALRFSFLLYIPVSFGATILSVGDMVHDPLMQNLKIPYLLALIASLIASFYSLKWFMNIMRNGRLKYFSYYCFLVGIFILLFM